MTNIVPVLQLLGLPLSSGTAEVIEAIRGIQRTHEIQVRKANAMEEAWKTEHARVQRAENPNYWRAIWTGDVATNDLDTTALQHGNLVELAGVGQVLFTFRPCCQNLRCECSTTNTAGYCVCHDNDE